MWPWHGVFPFWMPLFWLIVIAVLIWLLSRAAGQGARRSSGPKEESPETILKRRYARGEIDREEYQRRLEDLRK
jgi:putative membrane protein